MNKTILTQGVFAALLLASTLTVAEEYPATNYEPKVLFHDGAANESAKKSQPAPKAIQPLASVASSAKAPASTSSAPAATAEKAPESDNSILLLGLLAVGGFFFYKSKSKCGAKSHDGQKSHGGEAGGLTGVARYLRQLDASAGTSVTKYLNKKDAEAQAQADAEAAARAAAAEATGVAKYLKDHANDPKATVAASGSTGVAKYLRDRG